jgi:thioredoxin reductase (NADPH)
MSKQCLEYRWMKRLRHLIASKGLSVLMLETRAYGGQAGDSARIENYLGFPTGISGAALTGRAYVQAQKFGVEIAIPAPAQRLLCATYPYQIELCGSGQRVQACRVVLASGARYRHLALPEVSSFEGRGVYYCASPLEARLCQDEEVVLVGGGNSAGQAAVFLASRAAKVHLLVRRSSLAQNMSSYLVHRIAAAENIVLQGSTDIIGFEGNDEGLQQVLTRHSRTGQERTFRARRVFVFLGASPNTGWLSDCSVSLDAHGFIITGLDADQALKRSPLASPLRLPLETSTAGVFAIGDVRSGSTERVAAAVGEGAAVVAQLHGFLSSSGPSSFAKVI